MGQSIEVFAIFCGILVVIFFVNYRSPLGPDRAPRRRRSILAQRPRRGSAHTRPSHTEDNGVKSEPGVGDALAEPTPDPHALAAHSAPRVGKS
jgi:hypothetical protein